MNKKTIPQRCRAKALATLSNPAGIRKRILKVMKYFSPCNALHIASMTGIPITSIRPRMTELSSKEYCKKMYGLKDSIIHPTHFMTHSKASCRVTGYKIRSQYKRMAN